MKLKKKNDLDMFFFLFFFFSSPEYAQLWVFSDTYVNLVTSCCRSVGFVHWKLCVVSLNSQTIQSKAFISAAKYEHLPFLWKLC